MSKSKEEDFKLIDLKDKRFNLLTAFAAALFLGSWSMVKNVESKIADVAKRETVVIEREIEIIKLRIDSLGGTGKVDEVREYCKENVSRLERRLEYVERHSVNPFKRRK